MDAVVQRTTGQGRTVKSCGPGAATLALSLWSDLQVTVTTSPLTGEITKYAVKPLRRGCRSASAEPVCSCAPFFAHTGTRDRGCSAHPAFPAPSILRGTMNLEMTRANHVARSRTHALSPRRPGQASGASADPGPICGRPPSGKRRNWFSDRSDCGHMSGLLMRSHKTAAKMGFTGASSKHTQRCLAPMGPTECCLATVIDRSGPSSVLEQASACGVRVGPHAEVHDLRVGCRVI